MGVRYSLEKSGDGLGGDAPGRRRSSGCFVPEEPERRQKESEQDGGIAQVPGISNSTINNPKSKIRYRRRTSHSPAPIARRPKVKIQPGTKIMALKFVSRLAM